MFNKLKLQFIFTNVAIVFTLFFLVTVGVYFVLRTNLFNHTLFFCTRLADGVNSGMFPDSPPFRDPMLKLTKSRVPGRFGDLPPFDSYAQKPPRNGNPEMFRNEPPPFDHGMPKVFFIKTDPAGKVIFRSTRQSLKGHPLAALVQKALKSSTSSGIIKSSRINYFYFKTALL